MKRLVTVGLIPALVAIMSASMLFGQAYIVTESTGAVGYLQDFAANADIALLSPANERLSTWQELPFTWNFYGEEVSGYYVSDNGYITFDENASVSIPVNVALPNATGPNNAIYAFWSDLELAGAQPIFTHEVRSRTVGKAPNRTHIIMWLGVIPAGRAPGATHNLSVAIAIHENSDFDIVFATGRYIGQLFGTVGCENAQGTVATVLDGNEKFPFPRIAPGDADDIRYEFRQTTVNYDITMAGINVPEKVVLNEAIDVTGKVRNTGAEVVTSFDYHYRINEGPVYTTSVSGLSLATNQTHAVKPDAPWIPGEGGEYLTITAWVSNMNGGDLDELAENDMITAQTFGYLNISGDRRVLLEEFTGAWCGWCTDGAYQVEQLLATHDKVAAVAIHAGGTDRMIIPEGATYASTFRPAYPEAMIDRLLLDDDGDIPISRSNNAWFNWAAELLNGTTPLEVTINKSYNKAAREIDIAVDVNFVDYIEPKDLRLVVYVLEDNVVGEGAGYDQVNYLSSRSGYEGHPMYDEPALIEGYVHNHVLRAVPTGAWGVAVDAPFKAGTTFTWETTYKIPSEFDDSEITLVAYVSDFAEDVNSRGIVNCEQQHLSSTPTDMEDNMQTLTVGHCRPNPASGLSFLEIDLTELTPVTVELFTVLGQKVATVKQATLVAGKHSIALSAAGLEQGMYLIRVQTGDELQWRKLQVAH